MVALNPANDNMWDDALRTSPDMSLAVGMNIKKFLVLTFVLCAV